MNSSLSPELIFTHSTPVLYRVCRYARFLLACPDLFMLHEEKGEYSTWTSFYLASTMVVGFTHNSLK